jgi:uncharacterized protein (DUF2236 family)
LHVKVHCVTRTEAFERHRKAVRERLLRSGHVPAGPGSVGWKLNRERVVVAGWGRAILLQLAHPALAAGVDQHSTFRGSLASSFRRLHSTVGAMLALTFGDTEQIISAAAGINAIHDRVSGHVPTPPRTSANRPEPPGTSANRSEPPRTYSAHDSDLQRWVHATMLDSVPLIYERLVGRLTPGERDCYCAEAAIMEPLMGMPAGTFARDTAELNAYMSDMLGGGTLVVTDTSRALAHALLYPPQWWLAWPAFRALQLLTIGTLPPTLREAYGFTWSARDERALARWTSLLRTIVRVLPSAAREWPVARRGSRRPVKATARLAVP